MPRFRCLSLSLALPLPLPLSLALSLARSLMCELVQCCGPRGVEQNCIPAG